jgi:dipeptidyl aminopeptidase/acylaminoacyl peptidase
MLHRWITTAALALLMALPGLAQAESLIAYTQDGELFLLGPNGSVQVTQTEQEFKYIPDMRWSPDGSRLAFTQYVEEMGSDGYPFYRTDLFVIDPSSFTPGSLTASAAGIASGFPPAWGEDGALYFVRDNPNNMNATSPDDFMMEIFRLSSDGSAQSVANVPFGVGCGGGTSEPHYMLYNAEAGFGGNPITFLATRYGLLVSINCGGVGLNLVGFDGSVTRLDEQLARVALAADGRTLAALALDYSSFPPLTTLYLYDLETRSLRQIATSKPADQLGWGGDGALYYSSSVVDGELFSAEEAAQIGEAQGYDMSIAAAPIPAYRVTVNRIDLASGSEAEVAAHSGSFVGRLRPVAGGIAYSLIGSLEAWGRGLIDGSLDPMSEAYYENWTNYVSLESFIFELGSDRNITLGRLSQIEIAP